MGRFVTQRWAPDPTAFGPRRARVGGTYRAFVPHPADGSGTASTKRWACSTSSPTWSAPSPAPPATHARTSPCDRSPRGPHVGGERLAGRTQVNRQREGHTPSSSFAIALEPFMALESAGTASTSPRAAPASPRRNAGLSAGDRGSTGREESVPTSSARSPSYGADGAPGV